MIRKPGEDPASDPEPQAGADDPTVAIEPPKEVASDGDATVAKRPSEASSKEDEGVNNVSPEHDDPEATVADGIAPEGATAPPEAPREIPDAATVADDPAQRLAEEDTVAEVPLDERETGVHDLVETTEEAHSTEEAKAPADAAREGPSEASQQPAAAMALDDDALENTDVPTHPPQDFAGWVAWAQVHAKRWWRRIRSWWRHLPPNSRTAIGVVAASLLTVTVALCVRADGSYAYVVRTEPLLAKPTEGNAESGMQITVLERGDQIEVLEFRGDWTFVRDEQGQAGYVRDGSLQLDVPSVSYHTPFSRCGQKRSETSTRGCQERAHDQFDMCKDHCDKGDTNCLPGCLERFNACYVRCTGTMPDDES